MWFKDGNFFLTPMFFLQTYVVLLTNEEGAVSVVYAFIPHKTHQLYEQLFE